MTNSKDTKRDPKSRESNKKSRLDTTFPNIWLLSATVIAVIILMVVSGWKIINVEAERNAVDIEKVRIEKDREQLERDLHSHSAILKALPSLKDEHDNLQTLRDKIIDELQAKQTGLESLETQLKSAQEMLDRAIAERNQAISDEDAARKSYAQLQNDIKTSRSTSEQLKSEVAQFQKQSGELKIKVKDYQIQERNLSADVAGLEKRKENLKKELLAMAEDRSEFLKLSNRFNSIADKIDVSRQKTDKNVSELQGQSIALKESISAIHDELESLSGEIKRVQTSSESLINMSQSISDSAKTIDSASGTVDKTIGQLKTSIKSLEVASKNVDIQATQLAQAIDSPVNSINRFVSTLNSHNTNLDDQLKQLASYLTGFKTQMIEFNNGAETLKGYLDSVQKAVTKFDEFKMKMDSTAKGIDTTQSILTNQSKSLTDLISQAHTKIGSDSSLISEKLQDIIKLADGMMNQFAQVDKKIQMLERQVKESVDPTETQ